MQSEIKYGYGSHKMKGPAEKFRYNKTGICAFHVTFPTGAQRLFQTLSQHLQDVTELYLFLLLPQNSRHRLPFCNKATHPPASMLSEA